MMKCVIDGKGLAGFTWGADAAVRLGSEVMEWLRDNKVWDGPDRHFADLHDPEDLQPLQSWDHIHENWLMFDWNNPLVGRQFRARFSDWRPHMIHECKIKIPGFGDTEKKVLKEHMEWLIERQQSNWTFIRQPCPDTYQSDHNWIYEFSDLGIAVLFKLTWGGVRVQDTDQ